MSSSPVENVVLRDHTTFRMGGVARYIIPIRNTPDIPLALTFAREHNLPAIILGGGSNVLIDDSGVLQAVVLKMEILGISTIDENDQSTMLRIGAGVIWDDVVHYAVEQGLSGIEAMSAIPGTAGATPIQNVGAYGQEIEDTLISLEAYDCQTDSFVTLSNTDCGFTYRDSIFKQAGRDRYIITSIVLRLSKQAPTVPSYPGVKEYFEKKGIITPTLQDIREAIIAIRAEKLPDPSVLASVGSFFKNPIVSKEVAAQAKEKYPKIIIYDLPNGMSKIGAGSLIDTLGLKGKRVGNFGTYEKNALVIVNYGNGTFKELEKFKKSIIEKVQGTTSITLEMEPVEIY